jgi:hypothetical protein
MSRTQGIAVSSPPGSRLTAALNEGLRHLDGWSGESPRTTEDIVSACREIALRNELSEDDHAYLLTRQLLLSRCRGLHSPLEYPEAATLAVLALNTLADDDRMWWFSDLVATLVAGATEKWGETERQVWPG